MDFLLNIGALVVLVILLAIASISYFLLKNFIGEEASIIIGLIIGAYPAFLVFKKI